MLPVERNTGLGCIPVGMTVYYECTVNDDDRGNTVWQGSVFNCPSPSAIILAHFLYESTGSTGSCGKLSAMSVGVSGNEYTSRLNLTATLELNEMTIECTVGGSMIIVGSDILRTGGKCISIVKRNVMCLCSQPFHFPLKMTLYRWSLCLPHPSLSIGPHPLTPQTWEDTCSL